MPETSHAHPPLDLDIRPLTPDRWPDLETLFGPRGACAGCWRMWWRLTGPEYAQQRGDPNKSVFKSLIQSGEVPGLLAYAGAQPVGWSAIAPRDSYKRLREDRIRILKRVDDLPVWSVTCFYVASLYRRKGVSEQLLQAARGWAAEQGASIVEAYPVDPQDAALGAGQIYPGVAGTFRKLGFTEVARRHPARPIMRYYLK